MSITTTLSGLFGRRGGGNGLTPASIGGVLDEQVRLRLDGAGPLGSRAFIPETAAARALVADPVAWPVLDRFLRTGLRSIEASPHARVTGFSLAMSPVGTAANAAQDIGPIAGSMEDRIREGQFVRSHVGAWYTAEGRMGFNHDLSATLLRHAREGSPVRSRSMERLSATFAHELGHAELPAGGGPAAPGRYAVEELRATWLERHRAPRLRAELTGDVHRGGGVDTIDPEGLRRFDLLLARAGLASSGDAADETERLLATTRAGELPEALAARINARSARPTTADEVRAFLSEQG